jgi:hypothetical protein
LLSIQLEANEKLDRYLEAVGKSLASLIEEALDTGWAVVASYPHPGAVTAASLAFSHIHRLGARGVLRVSIRPPEEVDSPTLLFGYPSLSYKASDVKARLLSFTYAGYNKAHPPPGSVYVGVEGSLSSAYALSVDAAGLGGFTRELKALSLSGIYLDGKVARSGRIGGIDRVYAERLGARGELSLRVVTTLRVYKPHRYTLCEAMHRTAVPPFPLAVDVDECLERLAASGLRQAASKPAAALESSEINSIVDLIAELLEGEVDTPTYVAGSLVVEGAQPEDPREAGHALIYAIERTGSYASAVSTFVDEEIEYPAIEALLEESAARLVERTLESKPSRARGPGWLRLYTLEGASESPSLSYMILRAAGRIEDDTVIAAAGDEGILISPLQASMAEYTLPKRLVESRAAVEEGFWLAIREGSM